MHSMATASLQRPLIWSNIAILQLSIRTTMAEEIKYCISDETERNRRAEMIGSLPYDVTGIPQAL